MTPLALLESLANHPDVISWVAPGRARVDVSHFDVPGVELFGDELGCVLFCPTAGHPGIFEMHYLFTPHRRGRAALEWIRHGVRVMFTQRGATAICGAVPREHRASRVMSRALGARPLGSHTDPAGRACIIYVIERKSWAG